MPTSAVLGLYLLVTTGVLALVFRRSIRRNFIYAIPLIHQVGETLADVVTVGGVHTGYIRAGILLAFIALWLPRLRSTRANVLIYVFLLYLVVLLALASEPLNSLNGVLRLVVAMMMFPIAYSHFRSEDDLRRMHVGVVVLSVAMAGYFVLAQVLQLGEAAYGSGAYLGLGSVYFTYIACYALLLAPLIFRTLPPRRRVLRLAFIASLVVLLLMMVLVFRRGSLLALGVGGLVYLAVSRHRLRLVTYVGVAAVVAALASPLWWGRAMSLVAERGDIVGFVSNTERGRMAEFGVVMELVMTQNLRHSLLGSEVLNSRVYLGTERTLHVDYMNILLGAGVVGLVLYLAVWGSLISAILRWSAGRPDVPYVREVRAAGLSLVAASLTIGFSTQIWATGPLAFVFLNTGALVGFLSAGGRLSARPAAQPRARAGHLRTVFQPLPAPVPR